MGYAWLHTQDPTHSHASTSLVSCGTGTRARRCCHSRVHEYSTGTTKSETSATAIPPKVGIAIGTMMSEPRPVDVSTGSRARIVVAVVMSAARIRSRAPSIVAVRMAWIVSGLWSSIRLFGRLGG